MDVTLYPLLGVLAGVVLTQASNYFLESKKSKGAYKLKKLELEFSEKSSDMKSKQSVYSDFLKNVDMLRAGDMASLDSLTTSFYSAIIIAEKKTQSEIVVVFNMKKNQVVKKESDIDSFMEAKTKLLKTMHDEISK
jgi:hypothetical protein